MQSRYKYLLYLSLIFLAFALHRADYLKVPQIVSFSVLIVSFVFLIAGFISHTLSWKQIVKQSGYHVALSECLAGMGLSIFGKYIPGKIWVIMGRAAYIAEKSHYPLVKLSAISVHAEFITLWLGLIFGAIGFFLLKGLDIWSWLILLLWLGLTVVIFSKLGHVSVEHLTRIILHKDIKLPRLCIKSTLSVMPWFVMIWVLYSIGFYMLVVSLTEHDIPWSIGLAFPLAATLGIMALVAPGGLGVREGVMVGYLTLAGLPIAEAVTIAGASRLWFLLGEVFIFTVGWLADKRLHKDTVASLPGYVEDFSGPEPMK